MYWECILKEYLLSREASSSRAQTPSLKKHKKKRRKIAKYYFLGDHLKRVYFTYREAECMILLLHEKSTHDIAKILKLSARTVEYYLKNMKIKSGCNSKTELLQMMKDIGFAKKIDFCLNIKDRKKCNETPM